SWCNERGDPWLPLNVRAAPCLFNAKSIGPAAMKVFGFSGQPNANLARLPVAGGCVPLARDAHPSCGSHLLVSYRGEVEVVLDVFGCDEDAVDGGLLFFGQLTGGQVGVRLLDGQGAELGDRLEDGGGDGAFLDGVHDVLRAVEADDDDISHASGLQRSHGAHGHRVVTGDDAVDVRMRL